MKITFDNLAIYSRRIKDETSESEDSNKNRAQKKVCPQEVMHAACKLKQYPLQCQLDPTSNDCRNCFNL